jgi:hypothetical protein
VTRLFEPLIKHDFFTEEELELIWCELKILARPFILQTPEQTNSARVDGEIIKNNKGIFLDKFYLDMTKSPMFDACLKIFAGVTEEFANLCYVNSPVLQTRKSSMLLSYYEDSDYYLPHQDHSITTVLYWICQEPKAFTGGDLVFPEIDLTVPFINNTMVMFPSVAEHAVTKVKLDPNAGPHMGRFAITQFLNL